MRRRTASGVFQISPASYLYCNGVGVVPYSLGRGPGHVSLEASHHQWRTPPTRRAAWSLSRRFGCPAAATAFDGIACSSWPALWACWTSHARDLSPVTRAIALDAASVDAFETRDPRGAAEVADYLTVLRADLDTLRAVVHELDTHDVDVTDSICSGLRYGGSKVAA